MLGDTSMNKNENKKRKYDERKSNDRLQKVKKAVITVLPIVASVIVKEVLSKKK